MYFNANTYFETIARESVYLNHTDSDKHFGIASGILEAEDLCNGVLSRTDHQLIVIDNPEGRFLNNDSVCLIEQSTHAFIVLKHVSEPNVMSVRSVALQECLLIGKKIFARMRRDMFEAAKQASNLDTIGLRHLDESSFRYFSVGTLGDNFLGVEFSFLLVNNDNTTYDPDEWIPISES